MMESDLVIVIYSAKSYHRAVPDLAEKSQRHTLTESKSFRKLMQLGEEAYDWSSIIQGQIARITREASPYAK